MLKQEQDMESQIAALKHDMQKNVMQKNSNKMEVEHETPSRKTESFPFKSEFIENQSKSSCSEGSPSIGSSDQSNCSAAPIRIWSGQLALDTGCRKMQIQPKTLHLSAYGLSNICYGTVAPLVAQFEGMPSVMTANWPPMINLAGVCLSNNLHFFKKYCVGIVSFSPEHIGDSYELFGCFLQKLTTHFWAGVVDLPENTLLLVPVSQEKMLGILLSKMNVTITNRVQPAPQVTKDVSEKYNREDELKFEDKLVNGFYDPGRGTYLPLDEYLRQPVIQNGREVIVVDSTTDSKLAAYVHRACEMLQNFPDSESQARVLALFVANCFGGSSVSSAKCLQHIEELKVTKNSNVLPLGIYFINFIFKT